MKSATIAEIHQQVELQQVKGFLADDEAEALYRWAFKSASRGPCLEVGSYCGKSSIYLASACKAHGSVLFAVDHHRGSEEHQPGEQYHDADLFDAHAQAFNSFPEFRKNIERFDLSDTVVPLVASSQLVCKAWNTPLALVFIDGGHSHEMAIEDCTRWSKQIQPGGVLAIHDIFPNPQDGGQGPYLGLQAVVAGGGFTWVETTNSLAILIKQDI